jgi:hypothetical protein
MDITKSNAIRQMYLNHAKGKSDRVREIACKFDISAFDLIEWTMSIPQLGGFLREMVVCMVVKADHSTDIIGYDGTTKNGDPLEVKTETNRGAKTSAQVPTSAKHKMRGNMRLGTNISSQKLSNLKSDNPVFAAAGFTPEGVLTHVVTFKYNDSKIHAWIDKRRKWPAVQASTWKNSKSINVLYKNRKYCNTSFMSNDLLQALGVKGGSV